MSYSFNFCPLIFIPTRVTTTTSSLIDNIFTNNLTMHKSGVICSSLSDHFPIFTSSKIPVAASISNLSISLFNYNSRNINKLNYYLKCFDWSPVLNCPETDKAFSHFVDVFGCAVIQCCQITKKIKTKKQPCITNGLVISSKTKNKLYKNFLKSGSVSDQNTQNIKICF